MLYQVMNLTEKKHKQIKILCQLTKNCQEKQSFVDYKTRGSELYLYNSINQEAE